MDNDAEGLKVMSEGLLECNLLFATTLTSSKERLKDVAATIASVKDEVTGSKIQGIYLKVLSSRKNTKGRKIQLISRRRS